MASSSSRPLFASDLDGTLIFSAEDVASRDVLSIPDGSRHVAAVSLAAVALLRQIAARADFVPVTSRSVEQYLRLAAFREAVSHRYALVSNGGNLIVDGVLDQAYREAVAAEAAPGWAAYEAAVADFERRFPSERVSQKRLVDGVFYLYNLDAGEVERPGTLASVRSALPGTEACSPSLQERKLLLLPPHADKRAAVARLVLRLGSSQVLAAGDSAADLGMLRGADRGFALAAGELARCESAGNLRFWGLEAGAMAASEAMLEAVLETLEV